MHDERGSGLFGTVLGVGIFLLLMATGVQVLTHLYAASVVEAVAYDAAQAVTSASSPVIAHAEQDARDLLGRMADDAVFDWDIGEDDAVVTITTRSPSVLPARLADRLGLSTIESRSRMRVEEFR